jgi:hypothetical protein
MARVKIDPTEVELARIFKRGGYVRLQNPERMEEGAAKYKKGDEVRLMADSAAQLRIIRRLLRSADFTCGRPYLKHKRWCQPLYGREATARFLEIVKKASRAE